MLITKNEGARLSLVSIPANLDDYPIHQLPFIIAYLPELMNNTSNLAGLCSIVVADSL